MIDEIRKIKLQPILAELQREDEIKAKIKNNEEEIAREYKKDLMSSKAEKLKTENYKLKDKLNKLERLKEEKSRIESASLYDLGMDFQEAVEFLQRYNIEIVLTEEDKDNLYSKDSSKREYKSTDDFILVHKTDYIPEESKIRTSKESKVKLKGEMKIGDQHYDYQYSSERDTIHCAVNGEVGDHEFGSWHNCPYAILIPFNSVPKEQIGIAATQDTVLKGGVNLQNNAYILCPRGKKEEIQAKNPNVNVIEYEGPNVSGYADALVRGLGYENESCSKWGWINEEQNAKFNGIMKKEGFKNVGIPHSYSEFEVNDNKKRNINKIVEKSKLIKKMDVIKKKEDLDKTHFVAEDIEEDDFNILVTRLKEEEIPISDESITLIHNLYKLNLEEYSIENLRGDMPNTEETEELLSKFKNLLESDNKDYDRYFKKFYIRSITEYAILKEIGRENLETEKQKNREKIEIAKQQVLLKKTGDFNIKDLDTLELVNATEEELKIYRELIENEIKKINTKLQEKGIDKYYFTEIISGDLGLMRDDYNFEEINKDLDTKKHYRGLHEIVGIPTLDFEQKEDETVGEYLERLGKYTDCFSKYYDGHTVDESITFDENGNLIEVPKVENFEKVATSKEAVNELHVGEIVQEIRDEMNPDKTKEEVETEYD